MFLIKSVRAYGEDAHSVEVFDGIFAYENDGKYTTNGFCGVNLQIDHPENVGDKNAKKSGRIFIDKADDILGIQEKKLIKMSITGKSTQKVEGVLVFINAPLLNTRIISDGVHFINEVVNEAVIFLNSTSDKIYLRDVTISYECGKLAVNNY